MIGNHDSGRRTGLLKPAGHDPATGLLVVDTDPPLVLTHVPTGVVPPDWVNLHGDVHNNEPVRETPHINVCVERTGYKPLPLDGVLALAKQMLTGDMPQGATTLDRIRNAEGVTVKQSETDTNGRSRTDATTR